MIPFVFMMCKYWVKRESKQTIGFKFFSFNSIRLLCKSFLELSKQGLLLWKVQVWPNINWQNWRFIICNIRNLHKIAICWSYLDAQGCWSGCKLHCQFKSNSSPEFFSSPLQCLVAGFKPPCGWFVVYLNLSILVRSNWGIDPNVQSSTATTLPIYN